MKNWGVMHWILLGWLSLFSLHGVAGASVPVVKASETDPNKLVGAVCVIRHQDQLVMLAEVITEKFSLPGGYIDKGETPQQAAARETLEETGIRVKVGDLIQNRGRAAIYACVAQEPILVSSFKDKYDHPIVASWFSRHFATEVKRVYLIDPMTLPASEYRYQKDIELLTGWLNATPESDIDLYDSLARQLNLMNQYELETILTFQQAVAGWPADIQSLFVGLASALNLTGEPLFIVFLVLLIASLCPTRYLLVWLFALVMMLFTTLLLNFSVTAPRPYFAMPQLQQIDANGFGFPSSHVLLATLVWMSVWQLSSHKLKAAGKVLSALLVVILVSGLGVARVWFGVNFFSDIVVSILLALGLTIPLFAWWRVDSVSALTLAGNRWFWLFATIMVGVVASYTLDPKIAYIFGGLLGVFLSVEYATRTEPKTRLSLGRTLLAFVAISLVAFGLYRLINYVSYQQTVSLIVLTIKGCGAAAISAWLIGGAAFIRRRLATSSESDFPAADDRDQ